MFYSVVGGRGCLFYRSPEPCIQTYNTGTHTQFKRLIYRPTETFPPTFRNSIRQGEVDRLTEMDGMTATYATDKDSNTEGRIMATSVVTVELTIVCVF